MKKNILFFTIISIANIIVASQVPHNSPTSPKQSPTSPAFERANASLSQIVWSEFLDPAQTHPSPAPVSPHDHVAEEFDDITPETTALATTVVAQQITNPDEQETDTTLGLVNGLFALWKSSLDAWEQNITKPMVLQNMLKKLTITGCVTHAYILISTVEDGTFGAYMKKLEEQSMGKSTRALEKAFIETMNAKKEKDFLLLVAAAKDDGILFKISPEVRNKAHALLKQLQENQNSAQDHQLEGFIKRAHLLQTLLHATDNTQHQTITELSRNAITKKAHKSTLQLVRFASGRSRSAPSRQHSSESE